MDDVWMWHHYVLVPKIYSPHNYNGQKLTGKDFGTILTFNRLTTGFRMVLHKPSSSLLVLPSQLAIHLAYMHAQNLTHSLSQA